MAKISRIIYSDNCDEKTLLSYVFKRLKCFYCGRWKDDDKLLFHKKLMTVVHPSGHYNFNDLVYAHESCHESSLASDKLYKCRVLKTPITLEYYKELVRKIVGDVAWVNNKTVLPEDFVLKQD